MAGDSFSKENSFPSYTYCDLQKDSAVGQESVSKSEDLNSAHSGRRKPTFSDLHTNHVTCVFAHPHTNK